MQPITILITDDHQLIRQAWTAILNSDPRFKVMAECATGEEAIELARQLRPDVVILDINLPGISGIDTIPFIRKFSPGSKILGVSLHTQPVYARKMMKNGAAGYVTKNSTKEEMFEAITEITKGSKYVCKEIKDILSQQMLTTDDEASGINSLSRRELEVITQIKKGMSSKEIASTLSISAKTVEVHRYNILKKLNLKNSVSLVDFVHRTELDFAN
jgi:DNA-binding NarL/FixJ family response regulator